MQQCKVLRGVRRNCIRLRLWGICGLGTSFIRNIQGVDWGLYEGVAPPTITTFGHTTGEAALRLLQILAASVPLPIIESQPRPYLVPCTV